MMNILIEMNHKASWRVFETYIKRKIRVVTEMQNMYTFNSLLKKFHNHCVREMNEDKPY